MSEVNRDRAFDKAVDLVINQDRCVENWTARHVAVQTSLVIAEAALLAWKGDSSNWIITAMGVLVGIVAIILAYQITRIILRQCEWQRRYVEMVRRTEGSGPFFLFEEPGKERSYIAQVLRCLRTCLIISWGFFLGLFLVARLALATTSAN